MKTQIHIKEAANAPDKAIIEQILVSAAERFTALDNTVTSRVPDTIICYTESFGAGFALGARGVGEIIVIEVFPGREPSPNFPAVESQISSELRRCFGKRVFFPKEGQFIQLESTLPESESSRDFHRKHSSYLKRAA